MNDPNDPLRELFAKQRQVTHQHAPRWQGLPEHRPQPLHRLPAWSLATAAVLVLGLTFLALRPQRPTLASLPPLLPPPAAEHLLELPEPSLTAWQSPTDFLLTTTPAVHIL